MARPDLLPLCGCSSTLVTLAVPFAGHSPGRNTSKPLRSRKGNILVTKRGTTLAAMLLQLAMKAWEQKEVQTLCRGGSFHSVRAVAEYF